MFLRFFVPFLFLSLFAGGIDPNRIDFVVGAGDRTGNYRLAAEWDFRRFHLKNWDVDLNLNGNASYFRSRVEGGIRVRELYDVGATPTLTFSPRKFASASFKPFIEIGIGAHYLTEKGISHKTFSTNFQFGDHIGVGVYVGRGRAYKLAYRFQHLSNGGIGSPNPGINFHLMSMGIKIR